MWIPMRVEKRFQVFFSELKCGIFQFVAFMPFMIMGIVDVNTREYEVELWGLLNQTRWSGIRKIGETTSTKLCSLWGQQCSLSKCRLWSRHRLLEQGKLWWVQICSARMQGRHRKWIQQVWEVNQKFWEHMNFYWNPLPTPYGFVRMFHWIWFSDFSNTIIKCNSRGHGYIWVSLLISSAVDVRATFSEIFGSWLSSIDGFKSLVSS